MTTQYISRSLIVFSLYSRSQAPPGNALPEALPTVYKEGRAFRNVFPAGDWEQGKPETGNKEVFSRPN